VKPYRFLAEADAEFQEQVLYYDLQAIGLGDKFIAEVEAAIGRARKYPESGSPISRHVRGQVLRGIKYSVLYVNEPHELVVVAVAPHRKRPNYWRKRLRAFRR
jgi:hypothetical protein